MGGLFEESKGKEGERGEGKRGRWEEGKRGRGGEENYPEGVCERVMRRLFILWFMSVGGMAAGSSTEIPVILLRERL